MKTICVVSRADKDGLVQIHLPEHRDEEVEILLTYKPMQTTEKRKWFQRFLDIQGAWQGKR